MLHGKQREEPPCAGLNLEQLSGSRLSRNFARERLKVESARAADPRKIQLCFTGRFPEDALDVEARKNIPGILDNYDISCKSITLVV